MTINCGTAWYTPVCGGFDPTKVGTTGTGGWVLNTPYQGTLTITPGGNGSNIRSAITRTDKRYWELVCLTGTLNSGGFICIGVLPTTGPTGGVPIGSNGAMIPGVALTCTYTNNTSDTGQVISAGGVVIAASTALRVADGYVVGVHADCSTGKVWIDINGVQIQGNPAAGTLPLVTLGAGNYCVGIGVNTNGSGNLYCQGNFLTGSTVRTPASGFSCWDD